ncbi:VIT domain-containing protein [Luteimonas sp. RD2P54]|uniref:VIT domain-containing protein n=1 Tax=Luteimonas endophytica TaxID=3042023 RepID=A0ABT6JAQ7_9GAMM|nr:VIT domain-containing protein [Luteimonas endophytica]MDH5823670.1 VIT domain-containing protein [Luteimonas endophytica]
MRHPIMAALLCAALAHAPAPAQDGGHLTAPIAPPLIRVAPEELPVRLESASVVVEPGAGVARTTIDMVFGNPNARVLEGNLQFPLRPGQQVVGFALDIDGRMRDAVPVEKTRGRQVFEEIQRRGIDPGLLEQTEGDFFRLRVYPFPAGGSRRVRVTLLEPLTRDGAGRAATVPLQFAAGLDSLHLSVLGRDRPELVGLMRDRAMTTGRDGIHRLRLERSAFRPQRGVTLRFPAATAPATRLQVHDGDTWFLAEIPVGDTAPPRTPPARIGLLWDSSASGLRRAHDLEFALLDAYFEAAGDARVELIRLRDTAEVAGAFEIADGDWRALRRALEDTVYDGASNPGGWTPDPAIGEYLLFGDGLFNYGAQPFPTLGGAQRLFAIHAGSAGDSVRLAALAAANRGSSIALEDSGGLAAAEAALLRAPPRLVSMDGVGAVDLVAESMVARDGFLRIAGRLTEPAARLRLRLSRGGRVEPVEVRIGDAPHGGLAAMQWARFSLAALRADPGRNRAAIAAIGRRFGVVTPETSLLVLEDVADYVRYRIQPPAALRDAFERLQATASAEHRQGRQARLDAVAAAWAERTDWWQRAFPKEAPREAPMRALGDADAEVAEGAAVATAAIARDEAAREASARPLAQASAPPPAPVGAAPEPATLDRAHPTGSRPQQAVSAPGASPAAPAATIALQPWRPDSPYARRLRQAAAADLYAMYLDERARQPQGTAFHLDVADLLFERGQPGLALRVLSNLAEMDLDNRHVLRVLGYRLMQADRADLALPVLERVLAMGAEEPQSYRDLALAYAATGQRQQAVEALYQVVEGEWDGRFQDIEQTALAELNAIVATAPEPLDTDRFDPRLLRNLPLDLRVVLGWDSDNSDMDLWVTDPNGEKAYYGNRLTRQGGRMSRDFTGGYGPEEFALRDAKPGTYRVEANFFGDRQQLVAGATTLQLWLSTGFGTPAQRDRKVTLRLAERAETVLVGEFEVAPSPARQRHR